MLSSYSKKEWLTILAIGVLLAASLLVVGLWYLAILALIATAALMSFFRDPDRRTPTQRGMVVAPADGRVSSIHQVEHFEPFNDSATCIRIFLSVLDVHVNRSPCHGEVVSVTHKPGDHLNALNPESAEVNESNLIVMVHPIRRHPIAAVRQVAGLLARTIVCGVREGRVVQRGERIGIINLGSTTELYLPNDLNPQVMVEVGQKVQGALTVVASISSKDATITSPGEDDSATAEDDAAQTADDMSSENNTSETAAAASATAEEEAPADTEDASEDDGDLAVASASVSDEPASDEPAEAAHASASASDVADESEVSDDATLFANEAESSPREPDAEPAERADVDVPESSEPSSPRQTGH